MAPAGGPLARIDFQVFQLVPRPFHCDGLSTPNYSHFEAIRISWTRH
jgi:hypothetical protein